MERRLSAILAADVAGYSRLMERDESDTFQRLRAHRQELFEPEVEKHHGRSFKLMGDGLLAETTFWPCTPGSPTIRAPRS